jgi:hypothetical protein
MEQLKNPTKKDLSSIGPFLQLALLELPHSA